MKQEYMATDKLELIVSHRLEGTNNGDTRQKLRRLICAKPTSELFKDLQAAASAQFERSNTPVARTDVMAILR
ncbi:hypothetical protein, partial [Dorea formicigenerans]|uniref:hypothetical protein n=1 Tax=Dorea formicigenerans TaxID=39486 RepID=UPI001D093302